MKKNTPRHFRYTLLILAMAIALVATAAATNVARASAPPSASISGTSPSPADTVLNISGTADGGGISGSACIYPNPGGHYTPYAFDWLGSYYQFDGGAQIAGAPIVLTQKGSAYNCVTGLGGDDYLYSFTNVSTTALNNGSHALNVCLYSSIAGAGYTPGYVCRSVTFSIYHPVPTAVISAAPSTITLGQSSNLAWSSTGALAGCTAFSSPADPSWSGPVPTSGSKPVTPPAAGSAVYGLICSNGQTTSTSITPCYSVNTTQCNINVVDYSYYCTADSYSYFSTTCTPVSYSCPTGQQFTDTGNQCGVPQSVSCNSVSPTYCGGSTTTVTGTATTTIAIHDPPKAAINATPSSITLGNSSVLQWSSANATACTASNAWAGSSVTAGSLVGTSSSQTVAPAATGTYTYGLTCTDGATGASTSTSATLAVGQNTGTVTVASVDAVTTTYPVAADWGTNDAFLGSIANPCDTYSCSGYQSNYANMPTGIYNLRASLVIPLAQNVALRGIERVPVAEVPLREPMAFSFLPELVATAKAATVCGSSGSCSPSIAFDWASQMLTSSGTANFVIYWNPVATMGVSPAAFNVSTTYPGSASANVQVENNTTVPGSTLNWTASSSVPWLSASPSSGCLDSGPPPPPGNSELPANGCSDTKGFAGVTITANSSLLPSSTVAYSTSGIVTFSGVSQPTGSKVPSSGNPIPVTVWLMVNPPVKITPPQPVTTPVGTPASPSLSCSGGTGPYAWSSPAASPASSTGTTYSPSYAAPGSYQVTCTDEGSGASANTTVTAVAPNCSFNPNPATVVPPQQSTLSWNCQYATSCDINGTSVSATAGTTTVSPSPSNDTYTLACTGNGSSTDPWNTFTTQVTVGTQGTNIRETNP